MATDRQEWGDLRDRVLRLEIGQTQIQGLMGTQTTQLQAMDAKLDQVLDAAAKRAGALHMISTIFEGLGHAVWALLGALALLLFQRH